MTRLARLRSQFEVLRIDAFLVTFLPHLRYLSGFTGSSGIGIVTAHSSALATDGRYADQVRAEAKGWRIVITTTDLLEEIRRRGLLKVGMRVGFDGNTLLLVQYKHLRKLFPGVKFLPKAEIIDRIASVKDASEIEDIRRAVAITDEVFSEVLDLLAPGVSELDIAAEIAYRQRRHGAEGDAFEAIVASGDRSALPHGRPTGKKLRTGELVTLDFGSLHNGYCSDMTRTVILGRPSTEAKRIYTTVLDAQTKAIEKAASGMKARDLDAVARDHIRSAGYEKYFRHSLGHGIGLQIHEQPRISVLSKAVLEPGNVITIEPGVYIQGFGGVRIEDDVVIRDGGCEVLNRSPKELLII
jgi:Xaa-Pro aminopeptidase